MPDERWLIAGLGNPGPEYSGNRHNAGYMVADVLAGRIGSGFRSHRARADIAEGRLAGTPVTVAKPRSFMNLSGGPLAALRDFYKIPVERIAVVHDELDLPFGAIRLKQGGGAAGHNGLRSITQGLGSPGYFRIRFGIGRPPGRMDPVNFVLRDFSAAERRELPLLLTDAADAVETLLSGGLAAAQNLFHTRGNGNSSANPGGPAENPGGPAGNPGVSAGSPDGPAAGRPYGHAGHGGPRGTRQAARRGAESSGPDPR